MDRFRECTSNGTSNGDSNRDARGERDGLERIGEPTFRVERRSTRVEPRVARPAPGYVGEEVIARVAKRRGDASESVSREDGGRKERGEPRDEGGDEEARDSWVDAFVTLFAIVLFGLGWALVELEGAERAANRYVPPVAEMRVAMAEPDLGADPFSAKSWAEDWSGDRAESPVEEASWTARAPQNSNR